MNSVYFDIDFHSNEMREAELPIDIRKPNAALVRRAVLRQRILLAPGDYVAVARLPSGQEIYKEFSVRRTTHNASIKLQIEPVGSHDESEEFHRLIRGTAGTLPALPMYGILDFEVGSPTGSVGLRAFTGNPLQEGATLYHSRGWFTAKSLGPRCSEYQITDCSVRIVQLVSLGRDPLNVLLPSAIAPPRSCHVIVYADRASRVEVHPQNSTADVLLQYTAAGFASEARTVAEQLLAKKMEDPIAAAVGAYTLLRLGDLSSLHDWTTNLHNSFPWLPDGVTILAEHLSRLGEHREAIDLLLSLPSRGLPIFTEGLSYALDRLRVYLSIRGISSLKVGSAKRERLRQLLGQLQRFAKHIDFRQPVVIYPGYDPNEPSPE